MSRESHSDTGLLQFHQLWISGDSELTFPELSKNCGLGLDSPPWTAAWKLSGQWSGLSWGWRISTRLTHSETQWLQFCDQRLAPLYFKKRNTSLQNLTTALLYFLWEETMLMEYTPSERCAFHPLLTEPTWFSAHTWGSYHNHPCPLHTFDADTTSHLVNVNGVQCKCY